MRKASGSEGSYLPVSIALTLWRETSSRLARSCWLHARSVRSARRRLSMTSLFDSAALNCQRDLTLSAAVEAVRCARYMARHMTKMFKIALPDGSVKEMPEGSTPADVAAAIGPGLAKAALAAKVDGEVRDIMRPFEGDSSLALITSRDEAEALELVRHDYAHVLAEAVQNLYPGTQITFGPATEDGFYYDFAPAPGRGPFTEEELPAIEEEMRRIIAANRPLIREEWSREQVREFFEKQGEAFKAEWVMELP